jgi:hypothetical protein
MAQSVLVIADSGSGKSSSMRNLDPAETFVINIANKPLPFKGWKSKYQPLSSRDITTGNMSKAHTAKSILWCLQEISENRPDIKNIVIDDLQYMSAFEYFDRANERGYDKFTDIATNLATIARFPKDMRDDQYVFFLTHSEDFTDAAGGRRVKAKTVGKMIDNALTLEGLFSIVLYARVSKDAEGEIQYVFETRNNGENTCKAPMGMFEADTIPNDLQMVKEAIISYENE